MNDTAPQREILRCSADWSHRAHYHEHCAGGSVVTVNPMLGDARGMIDAYPGQPCPMHDCPGVIQLLSGDET